MTPGVKKSKSVGSFNRSRRAAPPIQVAELAWRLVLSRYLLELRIHFFVDPR